MSWLSGVETQIADAVDAAIGSAGGVIIVRNAEERELATTQLRLLASRAYIPGIFEKTQIVVIPAARSVHWRMRLPG